MNKVWVSGAFDNLRSRGLRFLEEAARIGELHVVLWSDAAVRAATGEAPKFPEAERGYLVGAMRYVDALQSSPPVVNPAALPEGTATQGDIWVVDEQGDNSTLKAACDAQGVEYRVLPESSLAGFPTREPDADAGESPRKKVMVTGCYDWFHSGHVRFFEEVAEIGDLYAVVGHDANIRLLKGDGHPMFSEDERRYMVQSVRFVHTALVSSGDGWLDAEPEIQRIRPDAYAVNEDGDKPVKREFCEKHGVDYVVLKRTPKEGLPRRASTNLRGF